MINVVIIEDDPMVSMITKKIINSEKEFNVTETFIKGKGVVDYLLNNDVELIILDMYLPDMEGLDILEKLREKEINDNRIEAIFVTASNHKAHIERAFHLGIVDYLIKPFEFDRLKKALERYLIKKSTKKLKKEIVTQNEIDSFYHKQENNKSELPKGISEKTLEKVLNTLLSDPTREFSSKDVAKELKTSSITVKKYLDYLAGKKQIKSNIYYGTVGRPEVKYKI
ncbi:MAG: response regulator [Psychrilyobacter sp.]|uniref:response regulator n=1 Tax=Psychrilyobacter sp. TaxID=2586924 RepID=UPI003C73D304